MIRVREDLVVTLVMTAGVAGAAVAAMGLSPVARLAPLVVAVPTLGLLAVEILRWRRTSAADGDPAPSRRGAERTMLWWVGGLLGASAVVGMDWGLPLFVLLYLRLQAREGWGLSVIASLALWLILVGVLSALLHVHVYEGLLRAWLLR